MASSNSKGSEADLEELLDKELGLGRYQARVQLLCALSVIIAAMCTNEFVFTTGRTNTRCIIPECEIAGESAEFRPPWLANAVPASGESFDRCQRFAGANTSGFFKEDCPAALFNQNVTVGCEAFVYENTNTIMYSLDLACSEWRRSLVGSARTLGAVLALPAAGTLSDGLGRRAALAAASAATAVIGCLRYFATTYAGYIAAVVVEASLGAGAILSCSYILAVETIPRKYRILAATASNICFSIGQMLLALLAWAFPYWRHLTLVIYLPQLLTISYFWILPESIRWYLSKSYYEKAENALKIAARIDGRELSEKTLLKLKQTAEIEKTHSTETSVNRPWLVMEVFRHKPILLRCFVTPVWWITLTLIYYGLSINAVNISGNMYVNYMAVAAVDIPGFSTAMLLVDRIGRRPVLMTAYWICAACQIAYIFIPSDIAALSLTVYLVGKYSISVVVTALYLYTTELFPTEFRHSLFGFSSMVGRIGSITAPLTPALGAMVWKQLPFVLFAAMALVSGALTLLTPETRGRPLPHTMQEAAGLGRARTPPPAKEDVVCRL